ncbi:hypothetical protein CK203_018517 [Vitis vinifera]|uniref:Retrotransposon gag domain-containing protein n=1 Tax=Vitis vinifera TaxID=29760 RepID=A0A438J5U1_VITVI|nr:hypothetical protein CK203_018517 [Vitis vinifera]
MTSPSRSRSSARSGEGYFKWRNTMERRQRENERHMQILLQETRKLREENNVLKIQGSSQHQHYQRRQDPCHNQEAPFPRDASPTLGPHEAWPNETWCTLTMSDEMKVQALLKSHPSDNVRKDPKYLKPCGHAARPPLAWVGKDPSHTAPPGSISRRLDDMLSTPFSSRIIKYEPPRGFIVPKFSTYDGSRDPFDHIMHYRQLMTLDIGNDRLLCKVFPASLQGQALSWFHRLPANSIDNFRDLSEVFVGQYLCSARHKQNINTLQNFKMQENETLREFVKRFEQAVLQVESYSMDAILQIFKRSICPRTPFFESLAKNPPTIMDDLFRRASKYSMLEDDVRAATQQVLVAGQATRSFKNTQPSWVVQQGAR